MLIVVVIGAALGFGYRYLKTNTDHEIFKNSTTYVEGKLDDLARYRLQMQQTDDPVEQAAIQGYVVDVYANFDEFKIDSADLRSFLKDCRNGVYSIDEDA